ncbi:hypothetical protein P5G50_18090 [Leifsonia sp. F6_8S_P_1B]|uniref:Uncharacterized protein n=1 Tax=Leifsonia williamsii TaxID=3035919 RepID=A0ABT8KH98_9MICO|nr:hypothetical protein [Leifsonia williamsii]MDN4616363.1 hypothetical protein [Leifsonia williamsii]
MTARPASARAGASVALAVLAIAALAGCSGAPQKKPVEDYNGEPKGVQAPPSSAGGASWAAWLPDADRFGIVLYGSSTCPPKVQSIAVTADNQVKATLAPAPGGVCTRDYVPHTTVFDTPSGVSDGSDVTIVLPDATLTLPARLG